MSRPVIDRERKVFEHVRGDLRITGTWYMGERDEDIEPCLVIQPTRIPAFGYRPAIVPLSAAFHWEHPAHAVNLAGIFLRGFGREPSLQDTYRIAELVNDHLDHLCRMPPRPTEGKLVVADATITDEAGRQRTAEISQYR